MPRAPQVANVRSGIPNVLTVNHRSICAKRVVCDPTQTHEPLTDGVTSLSYAFLAPGSLRPFNPFIAWLRCCDDLRNFGTAERGSRSRRTDEARHNKISGVVVIGCDISKTG